jgi:hypothetical protein
MTTYAHCPVANLARMSADVAVRRPADTPGKRLGETLVLARQQALELRLVQLDGLPEGVLVEVVDELEASEAVLFYQLPARRWCGCQGRVRALRHVLSMRTIIGVRIPPDGRGASGPTP